MPHPAPPRRVFVYGTLRKGQSNDINRMLPAPRYLGRARLNGVMYHLGDYPGVVLGGPRWVQGEVYEVTGALEHAIVFGKFVSGPNNLRAHHLRKGVGHVRHRRQFWGF